MRDFTGFRFGNYHTDDLHLVVTGSSSRYDKNLLPAPTDYSDDVPGGNGKYYYGQTYGTREFIVNVAFDEVDEPTWRKISQIFSNDKPQDLVFDENPYKTYKAKLKSAPDFKFVAFKDRKTNQRIYKGEGTFNFICYHPFAFCFNKYIVRAADYYKCVPPKEIINKDSINYNQYNRLNKPKMLNGIIKDHYNVRTNMVTPWKGGYPTIEQVQNGELYFTTNEKKPSFKSDCTNENVQSEPKMIIDVRGYWDNIPQWECAAKLLTSPTLDYDQELIFMPQYSKRNYYNMDTGLNNQNGLIGSRLLVYNPGDIPVDFELKMSGLTNDFRKNSKEEIEPYRFRISRYNVQRLTIEQAVDWVSLTTLNREDNKTHKYGNKYVDILEGIDFKNENSPKGKYHILKNAHPHHLYYVEPIPKEKLGHFIRLFYWQSMQNAITDWTSETNTTKKASKEKIKNQWIEKWENSKEFANRYEELFSDCITDDESNELYWHTLKTLFEEYNTYFSASTYTINDFIYDFIYNPPEYIRRDQNENLYYGEFNFNIQHMPSYYTYDYMDITSKNMEMENDKLKPLFLDFESRMLYNINEPKVDFSDEENIHHFYDFKPTKTVFNDNIIEGHWFQLPPGWSLIDISPIVSEDIWGGKRWLDARPFTWGNNNEKFRTKYDKIYTAAASDYLNYTTWRSDEDRSFTYDETKTMSAVDQAEELIQFRKWYAAPANDATDFAKELYRSRTEWAEYNFLKILCDYWRVANKTNDRITSDIDAFWWYANSYSWVNFPPLYWGYADLLNQVQIKYIPQYY